MLAMAFVLLLNTSCATIFTGTTDTIRFDSEPQGASVFIDGIEICKTPCTHDVPRSISNKYFEISLDGYDGRVVTLSKQFNTISILNIFAGLVGFAVDAATGAIMEHDKKSYNIKLKKQLRAVAKKNPKEIHIDTVNKVIAFHIVEE